MLSSISVVYPMYNEKDNIEEAVKGALKIGYRMASALEIVVVDDASTDGCGAIADRLAREHPEVKVIHHPVNRKLGGALKTGFGAATRDWILYMDSDLPIKFEDLLQMAPLAEQADIVIGWRKSRAESWRRAFQSKVYNLLIRSLFGLHVKDVNFACKLFKRKYYIQAPLETEGSFIDAELLIKLQRMGATLVEIGMDYYPRVAGVSTLGGGSVALKTLTELLRYRIYGFANDTHHAGCECGRSGAESGDQSRDRASFPAGHITERQPDAERTVLR